MKKKLSLLVSICAFLSYSTAFAQDDPTTYDDYIINLKNDTIKCSIGHNFFGDKLKYEINGVRGSKTFDANSVKEFFLSKDSIYFSSVYLPGSDKLSFLQLLERGKINLYQSLKESLALPLNYSNTTLWYAAKGQDSLKQIKAFSTNLLGSGAIGSRKDRIKTFMDMIADNPNLLDRFNETRKNVDYNFDLIRYYIRTYNEEYLENRLIANKN